MTPFSDLGFVLGYAAGGNTVEDMVVRRIGSDVRIATRGVPIRRRSLHLEVSEQLRDMIVSGRLEAGERIVEAELCKELNVSRTPLREALKVLAVEGLIQLMPNRGARVTHFTVDEARELFEVVSGLERLAVELAAERASPADIKRLRTLHDRMSAHHRRGERHEYFRLNHQIHNAMVALSNNATLIATHAGLMARARGSRYQAILSDERWDESMTEHEAIMKALESGDGPGAGALLLHHVQRTGEVVQEVIAGLGAGGRRVA